MVKSRRHTQRELCRLFPQIADISSSIAQFGSGPIPLKKTGSNSLHWR
jgi:hypothetical protein